MATKENRQSDRRFPVAKYQIGQLSWGATGHAADTDTLANINMMIERVDIIVSNAANAITVDLAITDENGAAIITLTGLARNTKHVKLAYDDGGSNDFPPIVVNNTLTVSVDPSGDAGAGGITVDVILYGR